MTEHDKTMDNWLAGCDLAFDHKYTGPIGMEIYNTLKTKLGQCRSVQLMHKSPQLGRDINSIDIMEMQYADVLQVLEPAGMNTLFSGASYEK